MVRYYLVRLKARVSVEMGLLVWGAYDTVEIKAFPFSIGHFI
jgi:hypothetical protein